MEENINEINNKLEKISDEIKALALSHDILCEKVTEQLNRTSFVFEIDKQKNLRDLILDKKELTVKDIMDYFNASKPFILKLMKEVSKSYEDILYINGNSRNLSKLLYAGKDNKYLSIAISVIKEFESKKENSSKKIDAFKQEFSLNDEEFPKVMVFISKHSGGKIQLRDWGSNDRRITNCKKYF
jgi:hypothetical protein